MYHICVVFSRYRYQHNVRTGEEKNNKIDNEMKLELLMTHLVVAMLFFLFEVKIFLDTHCSRFNSLGCLPHVTDERKIAAKFPIPIMSRDIRLEIY